MDVYDIDNIIFTDEVHFILNNVNNYDWIYKNTSTKIVNKRVSVIH